jgi:CBS domain-containing protein
MGYFMLISDIMRTTLIKVRPEAPIGNVLIWYGGMAHVFRNTYVVDHCDRLLGVVTIHTFLSVIVPPTVTARAKAGELDGREELLDALRQNMGTLSDTPVGNLMDADYPFAHPEDLFVMANELIVEKGINALPVIDPNGVLVGEITRRMILHFLVQNL